MGDHVDLSSWQSRIAELERLELEPERDEDEEVDAASGGGDKHNENRDAGDRSAGAGSGDNRGRGRAGLVTFEDSNYSEHVPFKDGVLTIGCVGTAHTIAREFVDYASKPIAVSSFTVTSKQSNSYLITGYPNVGKSSLINGLLGRKLVSTSKTPGHTKHFQTIFLSETVRLCDCPGLVFPSLVPRPLQVLSGTCTLAPIRALFSFR